MFKRGLDLTVLKHQPSLLNGKPHMKPRGIHKQKDVMVDEWSLPFIRKKKSKIPVSKLCKHLVALLIPAIRLAYLSIYI